LVNEIILYYNARSKKHQISSARFELLTLFPAARNTSNEEIRYLIYMSHKCAAETCACGIKETTV